jgi:hypothetical protein
MHEALATPLTPVLHQPPTVLRVRSPCSLPSPPTHVTSGKAKGLSSSQVVAINLADGVLTMFAKTA